MKFDDKKRTITFDKKEEVQWLCRCLATFLIARGALTKEIGDKPPANASPVNQEVFRRTWKAKFETIRDESDLRHRIDRLENALSRIIGVNFSLNYATGKLSYSGNFQARRILAKVVNDVALHKFDIEGQLNEMFDMLSGAATKATNTRMSRNVATDVTGLGLFIVLQTAMDQTKATAFGVEMLALWANS